MKMRLHAVLQPRGAGVRFLKVVVALAIREFERRRSKLTSRERRKIKLSDMYVIIHESIARCVTRC